jgi:hypothetical protein
VVGGAVGDKETITFEGVVDRKGITGFRLEALPDAKLPGQGPGLATNGNFVLTEFKVEQAAKGSDTFRGVLLEHPSADFEQTQLPLVSALDGAQNTGWAVSPQFGVAHEALFETQRDAGSDVGVKLRITLDFQYGGRHVLGGCGCRARRRRSRCAPRATRAACSRRRGACRSPSRAASAGCSRSRSSTALGPTPRPTTTTG